MRAIVDNELCISCGMCGDLCPEIFEVYDEGTTVLRDPVPADDESCVQDAVANCPVDAISVRA